MTPNSLPIATRMCLFAGAFCVYALFDRAGLSSVDEGFVQRTTESLVRDGSFRIEELSGRTVSRFSLAPSLWSIPFFAASDAIVPAGPDRERWLLWGSELSSCAATALAVVLLASWLSALGHSESVSVGCGVLYGFGSLAFPYSSTLFVQVITTPILLWCCRSFSAGHWRAAGIAFALLVFCRLNLLLLWPAFVLAAWQTRTADRRQAIAAVTVGGSVGFALVALVNHLRGDPILAGAYAGETFTTPLWVGLGGLLFSVGKGLLWLSPISLLGLLALPWFAQRRAETGKLIFYLVLVDLLVLSKWWAWHGSWSWGPRLLAPILPLCLLPVAEFLSDWRRRSPLARRGFVLVASAGLAVNLWAASQPLVEFMAVVRPLGTHDSEAFFVPQTSPLGVGSQPIAAWLWQAAPSRGVWAVRSALALAALIALASCIRAPVRRIGKIDLLAASVFCLGVLSSNLPTVVDALGGSPTKGQYRHLRREGDRPLFRGRLVVPLRGLYEFYADPDSEKPMAVRLGPRDLFAGARAAAVDLPAGEHPIVVDCRSEPPGILRWTIPGDGMYKQPIPADYLLAPTPTAWQRFRVAWRHYGWLAWVPIILFLGHWFTRPDDATGAD